MVTFTARLKALPGKEAEAAEKLREMVASVDANEPGALAYICHQVAGCPGEFFFYEVYADEAAKDAHMKTAHFGKLSALFGNVLDAEFGAKVEDLDRVAAVIRV
jgi:(4S)-4-hydroxy-5-phosphonooxypentane-2,3-dione isomerase